MTAVATPDAARLIFAAVAGLILLLVLIIKFKVHAMISILIGAVGIGLMAGMKTETNKIGYVSAMGSENGECTSGSMYNPILLRL